MVDVESGFEQSIYDDRHTAKGETSILQACTPELHRCDKSPCLRCSMLVAVPSTTQPRKCGLQRSAGTCPVLMKASAGTCPVLMKASAGTCPVLIKASSVDLGLGFNKPSPPTPPGICSILAVRVHGSEHSLRTLWKALLSTQDAKRASELEGQFIFAKPDHVGVQVLVLTNFVSCSPSLGKMAA